jgi:predicted nuclease of predicted toxin-antitoxin system
VKFKLDENIGRKAEQLLRDAGHDVSTVTSQLLNGTNDESLFEVCIAEQRALVTLDHDFGQVLRFPPMRSAGIVILEVAPRAGAGAVENRIRDLIALLSEQELGAELWIIEPGRVRVHQNPDV